jgi:NADPH-dependent 2,4-dienoyl-CoA reductase/sulfur reductase-like enzyme
MRPEAISRLADYDVAVVGGGSAGLSAAIAAYDAGATRVLVLERDVRLGGILNQCIHNGFGLHRFGEELTGPEYAARYERALGERPIDVMTQTTVLRVVPGQGIVAVSPEHGVFRICCKAVVLAMGCRERPRGALDIPGTRPAGVFTAGTAQHLVNVEGVLPGREVVILGSGDIGLIMARRLTLEGAHVRCVAELMPYSGGLKRNIVQCLDDFGIPLLLSHTVVGVEGQGRVSAITLAKVDDRLRPIPGTEERIPCDTLLLSVGLLPENELSREAGVRINPATRGAYVDDSLMTSVPGVFACGNVLHVHDLVDFVSEEAAHAGECAARYAMGDGSTDAGVAVTVVAGDGVRYTVPSSLHPGTMPEAVTLRFRVTGVREHCRLSAYLGNERVATRRRDIVVPGEMQELKVRAEQLASAGGDEPLTVVVEGA